MRLAENRGASTEIVSILLTDVDVDVAKAARANLDTRL
jgi:hypothetical protein